MTTRHHLWETKNCELKRHGVSRRKQTNRLNRELACARLPCVHPFRSCCGRSVAANWWGFAGERHFRPAPNIRYHRQWMWRWRRRQVRCCRWRHASCAGVWAWQVARRRLSTRCCSGSETPVGPENVTRRSYILVLTQGTWWEVFMVIGFKDNQY